MREDQPWMQDTHIERPASKAEPARVAAIPVGKPRKHERHAWRLIVGLVGLLGAVWAVAIVSRYPNLLPV
jgi:hypothetical protein